MRPSDSSRPTRIGVICAVGDGSLGEPLLLRSETAASSLGGPFLYLYLGSVANREGLGHASRAIRTLRASGGNQA
jgi:hypothetical protein